MSIFNFRLANSGDLSLIGELTQARERQLTLVHNRAGSFAFNFPLDDILASQINEVSTCVIIYRSGEEVWSGPVWTVEESTPNQLQIGCVGWLQTLEKRVTKPNWAIIEGINQLATVNGPLIYNDIDAGYIALDLLDKVNYDSGYVGSTFVTSGTVEPTQQRTITYQPYSNVLTEITNLSDIESGFDLRVDPITRELNLYQKYQQIRSTVVFEYDGNTSKVSRNTDSSKICNRMIAYSSAGAAQADDIESQADYGLFEEAVSLSDVTDISILQAYANAEVAVRSRPLPFYNFEPLAYSSSRTFDPRIFEDYDIGDIVYLRANKGRLSTSGNQAVRIFGATIDFLPNGTEKVSSIRTTAS